MSNIHPQPGRRVPEREERITNFESRITIICIQLLPHLTGDIIRINQKKIDEIDTAMLALVALRMEQSKLIKAHKHGQPIQDAARELHSQKAQIAQVLGIEPTLALEMLGIYC